MLGFAFLAAMATGMFWDPRAVAQQVRAANSGTVQHRGGS